MKTGKIILIFLCLVLLTTGVLPIGAFAETSNSKGVTSEVPQAIIEQVTTLYNNNVPVFQTTKRNGIVVEQKSLVEIQPSTTQIRLIEETPPKGSISTNVNVTPGSMNYKLIDTWFGTSTVLDKLSEWISRFAAGAIPAMLTKNIWATSAGSASFEVFYNPPTTRYYTNKTYEASDLYYWYGKKETFEYSNSSRTNLIKSDSFTYKLPK